MCLQRLSLNGFCSPAESYPSPSYIVFMPINRFCHMVSDQIKIFEDHCWYIKNSLPVQLKTTFVFSKIANIKYIDQK